MNKDTVGIEKIEIDLNSLSKAKSKKRVKVRATATRKAHYREQEVGRKEGDSDASGAAAEIDANKAQMAKKNEYGVAMRDINEGDYVDLGPHYEGGYVVSIHDAERIFVTSDKSDRYNSDAQGSYVNLYDVQEVSDGPEDEDDDDDTGMYAPRVRDE